MDQATFDNYMAEIDGIEEGFAAIRRDIAQIDIWISELKQASPEQVNAWLDELEQWGQDQTDEKEVK